MLREEGTQGPSYKGTPSPASLSQMLPHNPHPGFPTFPGAGYDPTPSSQVKKNPENPNQIGI